MKKAYCIRFDWAIKRQLRKKANFVILEGFLSTVLGDDIRIEKILDSEGNKEDAADKFNRVDLLAENSAGELLIVEVQNNRELDYFHRVLYGISPAVTDYRSEGDVCDRVKKIYSINIIYFELGLGEDYVYHGRTEFRGIHGNDLLWLSSSAKKQFVCKKRAGGIYPEYYILRIENFNRVATTQLDEWMHFLKTSEIPESATAKGLPEARELLWMDNGNASERALYEEHMEAVRYQRSVIKTGMIEGREEGLKEGIREGLVQGEAIGLEKGRVEGETAGLEKVAVNAHRNGLTVEQIQAITQLGEEQIREILEKHAQ